MPQEINVKPTEAAESVQGSVAAKDNAVQLINDLQDISFGEIAVVIVATWVAIVLARRVLPFLAERGPNQVRLYLLGAVPIIRLLLMTVAILWIFPIIFNVTFQNFLVIAGGASVAIGFAFKDYVSSLIAGIVAIFERPYRPGDWVEIDDDYGEVQTVGLRAIRLRTASDDIVTVPHVRMWDSNISNSNDGARTLMCVADFYVAPDHDAANLREKLRDVALTSAYLEFDKPVLVMLSEKPWGTHYKVKAYPFDMRDQFAFVSDLTIRGKQAINECSAREVTAHYAVSSDDSG
ncbi:mechanosensitive ion channel family protein [Rubripirellula reticaptiva]|uniref:Small-conductance mechanosensitive channel n=1 Tax=Rubripirellula reticaptiva TaxID=2528013 RepID=A0A5C6FCA6_9BACT|nr:mechanosensitive ion channel domain-containing protein [Rubripirellula reticaptiva]TWU58250.1 Small-conductance mechanosensitive channel [Rubripirellula reticaptiva]